MRIIVTTAGGCAGLRTVSMMDTESLPDDERRKAERAAELCMAAPRPNEDRARDARIVTISCGGRSVSFQEHMAPSAWPALKEAMPTGRIVPSDRER